ncbi:cytoplasmic protein [Cryptococcus neoformans Bt120]|nr:cytoplasmic protein [Cryptococcus neoformans var. grubii Bt15]OXG39869.1 cytoplasmic protein [Cryptococcus neoformans var. grubii Bt120]
MQKRKRWTTPRLFSLLSPFHFSTSPPFHRPPPRAMSRPQAAPPRPGTAKPQGASSPPNVPRRNPGTVPGLARTASSLRQGSSLSSLPAHLRNLSAPRIPSPLGKGTPARQPKQSLPVRTSKTTERHVLLPEDPQLAPLPRSPLETPSPLVTPPRRGSLGSAPGARHPPDERSDAEKMTKREREENKLPRLTAYATADGYKLKALQAFLKREHGVSVVRVYDDCVYAIYNLPLLPGYGATTKVRSSPVVKSPGGVSLMERMTMAEEQGYNDTYFPREDPTEATPAEYILSSSPSGGGGISGVGTDLDVLAQDGEREREMREAEREGEGERQTPHYETKSESEPEEPRGHTHHDPGTHLSPDHPGYLEHTPSTALTPMDLPPHHQHHHHHQLSTNMQQEYMPPTAQQRPRRRKSQASLNNVAEAVFFSYGVSVFFGFNEGEEKEIMEDAETAGAWTRGLSEDDWEIEEFHYVHDPDAENPRIYNDMFTFKSRSHLFKLSLAHAIAQSTKLSIYESVMQETLSLTASFPKELSITGHLQLTRREALKMTGRLFKLRMDVNLSGGILDTPELFWSEASLFPLYEAVHEYLEIGPRIQVLNDRLAVAGDLLEIIHEYIEERATHRLTWIIIWLIVVACFVELGEVIARMVFHAIPREQGEFLMLKAPQLLIGAGQSFV